MYTNAVTVITAKSGMWQKSTRSFVDEASSQPELRRDQNFVLESPRTGQRLYFTYSHTEYSGRGEDHEVAGWVFKLMPISIERFPEARGVTFTLLND